MPEHHALLYITEGDAPLPEKVMLCEREYESVRVFQPSLNIDTVRMIIKQAYQKPFASSHQYIIVNADVIPVEAQNALLKVIEEPPKTTRFIIIVRPHTVLLPTVRSRLFTENAASPLGQPDVFTEFLASSVALRIELIAGYAKAKDTESFQNLYQGLLAWLATAATTEQKHHFLPHTHYLRERGASKKMLWEDIALQLGVGRAAR